MSKHLRRRVFVDRKVQGSLVAGMVRYWLLSMAAAGGLTVLGWIFIFPGVGAFVGPDAFMTQVFPMALIGIGASALVLPVLLFDLVRVSHKFAGPLLRLKNSMSEVAAGGELNRVEFRDEDYWHDVAEAYNQMLARFAEEQQLSVSDDPQQPSNNDQPSGETPTTVLGSALQADATVPGQPAGV